VGTESLLELIVTGVYDSRSVRVGERRSSVATGSLRGLFDDVEETKHRDTMNNAIVSSARPFHDIAHESERGGQCATKIKIEKCSTADISLTLACVKKD